MYETFYIVKRHKSAMETFNMGTMFWNHVTAFNDIGKMAETFRKMKYMKTDETTTSLNLVQDADVNKIICDTAAMKATVHLQPQSHRLFSLLGCLDNQFSTLSMLHLWLYLNELHHLTRTKPPYWKGYQATGWWDRCSIGGQRDSQWEVS